MTSTTQTAPQMPKGIPYIVVNEAAERFSYYGMRAILVVFLTKYLVDSAGNPAPLSHLEATAWYHAFMTACYLAPLFGAFVSDSFWGKYRTIIRLSAVYCLGHLCLALFETKVGFAVGLTLIAIGSGGIKPCVSAHVGDQFTKDNQSLLDKTFAWFYFALNFGALISTALTPLFLDRVGPWLAFGVPGVLMLLATIIFWMGRNRFIHVPPTGVKNVIKAVSNPESLKALGKLSVLYFFVAFFWALYDQTGSSWVLQAEKMNRLVDLRFAFFQYDWLQFEVLSSQVQAINPFLILIFVPLFYNVIFPHIHKMVPVTPLRKMGIGFALTAISFAICAYAEELLAAGHTPSILWQLLAFVVITAAEVLISITALEFSYTQAPNALKSLVMGLFFLSVSIGNLITAGVNIAIENPDGTSKFTGPEYFWFFAALVTGAGILYIFAAAKYQVKTYIQETQESIT